MKATKTVVVLAVLLFFAWSVLPASASDVRIVRLSLVEGDVQIDRGTGAGPETALLNMPVVHGTRMLNNDADSRLEVEFENGSTLRLAGVGEIDFRQLSMTSDGSKVSVIEVADGLVYGNVKLENNDDIRLTFNGEEVTLRKSAQFRIWVDGAKTELAVFKGEIQLQGHAGLVLVKKGETLTLQDEERERYFLAQTITPFDFDAWNKSRDEYAARYKNANTYSNAGTNYGGAYSYGIGDLAYYGSFSYISGFGNVWQPYGVGAGWDPFLNGAWAFYPGTGWVFVSGSPWGWAPYRYGSWTFVPGYGWGWLPGGYSHWSPVPTIVNTPPRYHAPTPPTSGQGPTTLVSGGAPPRHAIHPPTSGGAASAGVVADSGSPLTPAHPRVDGRVPGANVPPRSGGSGGGLAAASNGAAAGAAGVGAHRVINGGAVADQPASRQNGPAPMRQYQPSGSAGTSNPHVLQPSPGGPHSSAGTSASGHSYSGGGASASGHSYSGGGSSSSGGGHSYSGGGSYSGAGGSSHSSGGGGSYSGGGGSSSSGSSGSSSSGSSGASSAPSAPAHTPRQQ